uniref:Uncharacterized protein n=1 Tax=Timema cristinae TaxID=61476 RepID=A0A7R9D9V2_TIMCR|nr:unnamed protein product [Timema cristinae]
MKRDADGDMGTPQKRSRPGGDTEVRLLIPSKKYLLQPVHMNRASLFPSPYHKNNTTFLESPRSPKDADLL